MHFLGIDVNRGFNSDFNFDVNVYSNCYYDVNVRVGTILPLY